MAKYVLFEMPDNLKMSAYETMEQAQKTGKICKGTNEVTKAIERGHAKLVLLAEDVSPPEIMMHIPYLCKEKGIPFGYVPRRRELGTVAGLGVPTASAAIIDAGKARVALGSLAEQLRPLMDKE